jgi:cytochrome c-type biogenesis protein CcmE
MKPKYYRFLIIILSLFITGSGIFLSLSALRNEVVFFISPSEVLRSDTVSYNKQIYRLGGYVLPNSIIINGLKVQFEITDFEESLHIIYEGVLPDLFRDGQGVIAEGTLLSPNIFKASTIMAKHDENYKPVKLNNSSDQEVKS